MTQPGKHICLISPMNNLTARERYLIELYVAERELAGHHVYWPPRECEADSYRELHIAREKRSAIKTADAIHIWYSPESKEIVFDLAMAIFFKVAMVDRKKELYLANVDEFTASTKGDEVAALIRELICQDRIKNIRPSENSWADFRLWEKLSPIKKMLIEATLTPAMEWEFKEDLRSILCFGGFFASMGEVAKRFKLSKEIVPPEERRFDLLAFELAEVTKQGRRII